MALNESSPDRPQNVNFSSRPMSEPDRMPGDRRFIVELWTTTGRVCESFATYEEAKHRVDHFPAEALVGLPLIFEELPDDSQRLVREDGKPLQWHRNVDDRPGPGEEDALPLADESSGLLGEGRWQLVDHPRPQDSDWGEDLPVIRCDSDGEVPENNSEKP
jgi:hypothetical protein